jgi:O-antigen/teichoic acid export membrane protein
MSGWAERVTIPELQKVLHHPASRSVMLSMALSAVQGITALVTAKWLGPTGRGVVVLAWSISSLLLLVGSMGMTNSARVVVADTRYETDFRRFSSLSAKLVLLAGVPMALFGVLALWFVSHIDSPRLYVIFALYCGMLLFGALTRETLHGIGRHVAAISTDIVSAVIQFAGAVFLQVLGLLNVERLISLGLAGAAAQVALGLWSGNRGSAGRPRTDGAFTLRSLLRFSAPAIGLTLGQWVAWRGDRLILGVVSGPTEVGIYGTVSTMADIPWLIAAAVSAVLTNRVSATQDYSLVQRYRRLTLLATAAASLAVTPVAAWILIYYLGGEFTHGIPALLILAPAALLLASSQIDLAGCVAVSDLKAGARASLQGAAVLVVTAVPLGYFFGATGCAIASACAYAAMAVAARRAWNGRAEKMNPPA